MSYARRRSSAYARNRWGLPALVLAATVVLACGGDSATGANASPVGSFQLSKYNGKPLPTTIFADTGFMDVVTAGTLSLSGNGTYLSTIIINETVDRNLSVFVDTGSGKWTQAGSVMEFVGVDSVRQAATWDGASITVSDTTTRPTSTLVFTRK